MRLNNTPAAGCDGSNSRRDRLTFDSADGRAVSVPLASAFHLTAHGAGPSHGLPDHRPPIRISLTGIRASLRLESHANE